MMSNLKIDYIFRQFVNNSLQKTPIQRSILKSFNIKSLHKIQQILHLMTFLSQPLTIAMADLKSINATTSFFYNNKQLFKKDLFLYSELKPGTISNLNRKDPHFIRKISFLPSLVYIYNEESTNVLLNENLKRCTTNISVLSSYSNKPIFQKEIHYKTFFDKNSLQNSFFFTSLLLYGKSKGKRRYYNLYLKDRNSFNSNTKPLLYYV